MRLTFALLLVALAPAAVAQTLTFEGAELSWSRSDNRTDDYGQTQTEGSAELGFASGLSIQADLADWSYSDGDFSLRAGALHLVYDLSPTVAAGVFYTRESWDGENYEHFGLETKVAQTVGAVPVTLEGYLSRYGNLDPGAYDFETLGLDADVALGGGFSATGGFSHSSGDLNATVYRLGGGFALESGPKIGLEAIRYEDRDNSNRDYDAVALTLAFELKGGTTFRQRKWVDIFPSN